MVRHHFLKTFFFFTLSDLGTLDKSQLALNIQLYFWTQFLYVGLYLHPYASTIMFGYGSFVVVLKPKSVSPLNLSFFFFFRLFLLVGG